MPQHAELPAVWIMRAGKFGEDEDTALENGLAIIGFNDVADLEKLNSLEAIRELLARANPGESPHRHMQRARQLWAFREKVHIGDTAVLPLKTQPGQIALGRVTGAYRFQEVDGDMRHTRPVDWIRPETPRTTFQQDLLYSFGAFSTVCRITRHEAETRVEAVLSGRDDSGYDAPEAPGEDEVTQAHDRVDLEQVASDEIIRFIRSRFPGHDLARLVESLLQAEGFITRRSPPGPDGGADILAGRGPLGLDTPTICVQVKATTAAADVSIFRALQGTMSSVNASQGLLVCWGGFTQPLRLEARQHAFSIKLWDQGDLVQAIYRTYDRLSPDIQADLPLKQIWALVPDETQDI